MKRILVISDDYIGPNFLYGDSFVHARVKRYLQIGEVLVIGLKPDIVTARAYVHEGVSVFITPEIGNFLTCARKFNPDVVMVHFIKLQYMQFLLELGKPLLVFLHGFEATSWKRRLMNYRGLGGLRYLWSYYRENKRQLAGLRTFIERANNDKRIGFIFVSKWLRRATESDIGLNIKNATVIPNGIDLNRFNFVYKVPEDRKKILVLRSFRSYNYANDVMVDSILQLSKKPFFKELTFSIYGEGYLFKDLTSRLRQFSNVTLCNYFIDNASIPNLHYDHGVFLCPSRLDTQGVSMCEAMASGLVPITSPIGGIPEYSTDAISGFHTNSAREIAEKIEYLYKHPDVFLEMSHSASTEIKKKCDLSETVKKEIELLQDLTAYS